MIYARKKRKHLQVIGGAFSTWHIPLIYPTDIKRYARWHPYFSFHKSNDEVIAAIIRDWVCHTWELFGGCIPRSPSIQYKYLEDNGFNG